MSKTNKVNIKKTTSIDTEDKTSRIKEQIHHFLESMIFIGVMTVLMIWILLQDDIRLIFFTAKEDYIFNIISVCLCAIFIVELVLECIV